MTHILSLLVLWGETNRIKASAVLRDYSTQLDEFNPALMPKMTLEKKTDKDATAEINLVIDTQGKCRIVPTEDIANTIDAALKLRDDVKKLRSDLEEISKITNP